MAVEMYADTGEQLVYLVWEMQNDRPALAVICTTDSDLNRYVTADRKNWISMRGPVFVEKVMTNHLYGQHDAAIAMRIMRRM